MKHAFAVSSGMTKSTGPPHEGVKVDNGKEFIKTATIGAHAAAGQLGMTA